MMDKMQGEYLDIILKLLNNDATEKESETLNQWLSQSELNRRFFDEICDTWMLANHSNKEVKFDTLKNLENVKEIIRKKQKKITLSVKNIFYKIAAIFILSFSLGALTYYLFNNYQNAAESSQLAEAIEINAPIGSKSNVILPDGSVVWLNSDSKLSYSPEFGKENRAVELIGEAFFEVKKNTELPFTVSASDIKINVTGTSFNLKAYPDENTIETTLEEGEIILEKKMESGLEKIVTLKPKQRAVFVKNQNEIILSEIGDQNKEVDGSQGTKEPELKKIQPIVVNENIDTELYTSWKENKLLFRNEKLPEVFIKLERWYGIKINVIDKEILEYHFNGTIENETVTEVMKIIQYALPIRFEIEHEVITIRKQLKN